MSTCGKYTLVKPLGRGTYATVYLAEETKTSDKVALKISHKNVDDEESVATASEEIKVLETLSHSNIVKLLDFDKNAEFVDKSGNSHTRISMAMELARNELFDYIVHGGGLSEKIARYFFHQLIDGVEFMHLKGISHKDLKPENLLLDHNYNLKIADFGFASSDVSDMTAKGSQYYMAPEMHLKKKYINQFTDIFSIGVILFVLVSRKAPFLAAKSDDSYYKYLHTNRPKNFWKMHTQDEGLDLEYYSKEYMNLVTALMQSNPKLRLTLTEIKNHAWFKGEMPTHAEVIEEFQKRERIIEESNLQSGQELPTGSPPDAVFEEGAHRGLGDDDDENDGNFIGEKAVKNYVSEYKVLTQFFSTSELSSLYDALLNFVYHNTKSYSLKNSEYKVVFEYLSEKEDENGEVISSTKVVVTVNILKVVDQDKYCVEVIRTEGDYFVFADLFKRLKESFGGHSNATLS